MVLDQHITNDSFGDRRGVLDLLQQLGVRVQSERELFQKTKMEK